MQGVLRVCADDCGWNVSMCDESGAHTRGRRCASMSVTSACIQQQLCYPQSDDPNWILIAFPSNKFNRPIQPSATTSATRYAGYKDNG